jgi:hypothetical protein
MDPKTLTVGNQYSIDGTIYYYRGEKTLYLNGWRGQGHVFAGYNDSSNVKVYGDQEVTTYVRSAY